jgi:hypothetical protein
MGYYYVYCDQSLLLQMSQFWVQHSCKGPQNHLLLCNSVTIGFTLDWQVELAPLTQAQFTFRHVASDRPSLQKGMRVLRQPRMELALLQMLEGASQKIRKPNKTNPAISHSPNQSVVKVRCFEVNARPCTIKLLARS